LVILQVTKHNQKKKKEQRKQDDVIGLPFSFFFFFFFILKLEEDKAFEKREGEGEMEKLSRHFSINQRMPGTEAN